MFRKTVRIAFITAGTGLLLAVLGLGGAFWYLGLDKTGVFFEVAGAFGDAKVLETVETPVSRAFLISLTNDRGEEVVRAWYRKPRELHPNHQVLLLYAGLKTRETILELVPDRPDLAVLAIQYPYTRPRRMTEYLAYPWSARHAAYRTVAGGMLGTTFLLEKEGYAPGRVIIVGASLGSFFGGILGSIDRRIPRVVLVHGGGNFPLMIRKYQRLRDRGWPVEPTAFLADNLFGTFDPIRYVDRISPRELILISSRKDKYFPAESVEALHQKAGDPKRLIWMESGHVKSEKSKIVDAILKTIETLLTTDTFALSGKTPTH